MLKPARPPALLPPVTASAGNQNPQLHFRGGWATPWCDCFCSRPGMRAPVRLREGLAHHIVSAGAPGQDERGKEQMKSNSFDFQCQAVCVKLPVTHSHWANWADGAPPVVGAGGKSSFELLLRCHPGSAAPRRWGGCRMLPSRTSPSAAPLAPVWPWKSRQCFLLWGTAGCWCLTHVGNCLCCHPSLGDHPCCLPCWGCGCLLASPSLPGPAAHALRVGMGRQFASARSHRGSMGKPSSLVMRE